MRYWTWSRTSGPSSTKAYSVYGRTTRYLSMNQRLIHERPRWNHSSLQVLRTFVYPSSIYNRWIHKLGNCSRLTWQGFVQYFHSSEYNPISQPLSRAKVSRCHGQSSDSLFRGTGHLFILLMSLKALGDVCRSQIDLRILTIVFTWFEPDWRDFCWTESMDEKKLCLGWYIR